MLPADAASAGRWIPYVVVDDLDAAAKQAVALGGILVRDKTVGPAGTSIVVTDPGGALWHCSLPPPDDGPAAGRVSCRYPPARRPMFDDTTLPTPTTEGRCTR